MAEQAGKRLMVMVPVKPDQLAAIRAAAESEGMPVATWARVLMLKAARKANKGGSNEDRKTPR